MYVYSVSLLIFLLIRELCIIESKEKKFMEKKGRNIIWCSNCYTVIRCEQSIDENNNNIYETCNSCSSKKLLDKNDKENNNE